MNISSVLFYVLNTNIKIYIVADVNNVLLKFSSIYFIFKDLEITDEVLL